MRSLVPILLAVGFVVVACGSPEPVLISRAAVGEVAAMSATEVAGRTASFCDEVSFRLVNYPNRSAEQEAAAASAGLLRGAGAETELERKHLYQVAGILMLDAECPEPPHEDGTTERIHDIGVGLIEIGS